MVKISPLLFGVFVLLGKGVEALEDIWKFEEGSCYLNTAKPVPVDRSFVDSLRYLPAGSRYHLYFPSSNILTPEQFRAFSESDFYYDACPSHNITHSAPLGAIFSRGRVNFVAEVTTPPGLWVEGRPLQGNWGSIQHRVTLTDYKTFAFFTNCLTGPGLRSWNVATIGPEIDEKTKKKIEEHAIAQGFNKEHFVFLRYDGCERGLGNPLVEGEWREWKDRRNKGHREGQGWQGPSQFHIY